jgi:hypothetical protein
MKPLLAFALCLLPFALEAQSLTPEQQAEFLRTAKVIDARQTSKGITQPYRLTLTDGAITHDAHFQSVDQQKAVANTGRNRRMELNFKDHWRFNIAAHRVAVLLGIPEMVPVSIERKWDGRTGAMTWWVDEVLMDEEERRNTGAKPPDPEAWGRQDARMRVFSELVYDTDRNQGNNLITKDWRIVTIDFTRAFRPWNETPNPLHILRRCERPVLAAMRGLTRESVREAAGEYLTGSEVNALLRRRDRIVAHFDALIARLGEKSVLY